MIPYLTFSLPSTKFDEILYPEGFESYHFKAAIPERNKYLIDNSAVAMCYINYTFGGAYKTYEYALKKKINLINLGRLKSHEK